MSEPTRSVVRDLRTIVTGASQMPEEIRGPVERRTVDRHTSAGDLGLCHGVDSSRSSRPRGAGLACRVSGRTH